MTPKMMVLAATTQGPGTAKEIQKRLVDRWPWAAFRQNAAHDNLPALYEEGCLRLVERGDKPSGDLYEIADEGWTCLREWLRVRPPDPANRDPMHVKVQFSTLDELPERVREVRDIEEFCQKESDNAQAKLLAAERIRSRHPASELTEELDEELKLAELEDVTLFWGEYADRRKAYGDKVDEIYRRFSARRRLPDREGQD